MTVIYSLYKIRPSLASTEGNRQKNAAIRRCIDKDCNILFETIKQYPKRVCALCRYEQRDDKYRALMDERNFNKEAYLNKAKDLESKKIRKMEALKVIIKNPARPKRFELNQ